MTPLTIFLICLAGSILTIGVGIWFGFRLHSPRIVGTLLVVRDPVDNDVYMQLEIAKGKADDIYDGNEITLKVIEIIGPDKNAK